jgi:hypothetical protein
MKPPNVTLDNMCIIDIEKHRENAPQIEKLIQMHHDKEINLRVVAASASELKQDRKTHPQHFDEFKKRLASASLGEVKILPTLAYMGISFFDYCVVGGGWLSQLDKEIHAILCMHAYLHCGEDANPTPNPNTLSATRYSRKCVPSGESAILIVGS